MSLAAAAASCLRASLTTTAACLRCVLRHWICTAHAHTLARWCSTTGNPGQQDRRCACPARTGLSALCSSSRRASAHMYIDGGSCSKRPAHASAVAHYACAHCLGLRRPSLASCLRLQDRKLMITKHEKEMRECNAAITKTLAAAHRDRVISCPWPLCALLPVFGRDVLWCIAAAASRAPGKQVIHVVTLVSSF